jgi:hypothetical protein
VLAPEPGTTRVAGRVVSATGIPLAGATIQPLRGPVLQQPPELKDVPLVSETDAEGRCAFEALVAPGTHLQLYHERTFYRFVALDDHRDLAQLELVEPLLCELQVDLTREPELANALEILDENGRALEVLEPSAGIVGMPTRPEIRDGRSNVLRVPESARTLVLYRAGGEVLRRPLALDSEARTVFTP